MVVCDACNVGCFLEGGGGNSWNDTRSSCVRMTLWIYLHDTRSSTHNQRHILSSVVRRSEGRRSRRYSSAVRRSFLVSEKTFLSRYTRARGSESPPFL